MAVVTIAAIDVYYSCVVYSMVSIAIHKWPPLATSKKFRYLVTDGELPLTLALHLVHVFALLLVWCIVRYV